MSAGAVRMGRFLVADEMVGMLPRIGQVCTITAQTHHGHLARWEIFATSEQFDPIEIGGPIPLYDCLSDGKSIWFRRVSDVRDTRAPEQVLSDLQKSFGQ